jgi:hypothetical protein
MTKRKRKKLEPYEKDPLLDEGVFDRLFCKFEHKTMR